MLSNWFEQIPALFKPLALDKRSAFRYQTGFAGAKYFRCAGLEVAKFFDKNHPILMTENLLICGWCLE